jgi:hypothetical protein
MEYTVTEEAKREGRERRKENEKAEYVPSP